MKRASDKKTDNANLALKLELRSTLLDQFVKDGRPIRVMDCCAGFGRMWSILKLKYKPEQYLGFDIQKRAGSLKCDSARWLKSVGIVGNVIDVDTYGEPWQHWQAILEDVKRWPQDELLVFLTLGKGPGNMGSASKLSLEMAGLRGSWSDIMPRPSDELREILASSALARGYENGIMIVKGYEAQSTAQGARYFGLWLKRNGRET